MFLFVFVCYFLGRLAIIFDGIETSIFFLALGGRQFNLEIQ